MKSIYNLMKWQYYVHLLIDASATAFVIMLYAVSTFSDIVISSAGHYVNGLIYILIAFLTLVLVDPLVHFTFERLPPPYRWAD